jgi:DNA repair protein RadA/Sms
LLLAVLEKRAGLSFGNLDVFLNVVGGVRMQEPAGDLAVAAALASSVYDRATPRDAAFIGELGLGGEIRPVSQVERRVAEATNMGMKRVFVSERSVPRRPIAGIVPVKNVRDVFQQLFA